MRVDGMSIAIPRGDSASIIISCTKKIDGDVVKDRPFVDGDTVYFTVKSSIHTEDVLLQKICTQFDEGKAIMEINPEDTRELKYGKYFYDVQLIDKDDNVITIIKYNKSTRFIIEGEITYDSISG